MFKRCLLVAGLILAINSAVSADPIVWTVSGTWNDGGSVNGSFTYDADTNTYSNVLLTTTPGSSVTPGHTYSVPSDTFQITTATRLAIYNHDPVFNTSYIRLTLKEAMTNAGGFIKMDLTSNSSFECTLDSDRSCDTFRVMTSNNFVTTPEPSTALLLGGGLLGFAIRGRRKKG